MSRAAGRGLEGHPVILHAECMVRVAIPELDERHVLYRRRTIPVNIVVQAAVDGFKELAAYSGQHVTEHQISVGFCGSSVPVEITMHCHPSTFTTPAET